MFNVYRSLFFYLSPQIPIQYPKKDGALKMYNPQVLENIQKLAYTGNLTQLINEYKVSIPKDDYETVALSAKIAELVTGLIPSNNQLYAAYQMFRGMVIEMPTGDGKTLAGLITLLSWVRAGKTATYLTANNYLAERDFNFFKQVTDKVGLNIILLDEGISQPEFKKADMVVSDGGTLIYRFLEECNSIDKTYLLTDCLLVDEFDTVLIDTSFEPSRIPKRVKFDHDVFNKVDDVVCQYKDAILTSKEIGSILEQLGVDYKVYYRNENYIRDMILDSHQAWKYKENENYIVEGNKIQLLDKQGRRTNRVLYRFMQVAIEKRHGLEYTNPSEAVIGITYEGLIGLYKGVVSGMSGTLATEEEYIHNHYGLDLEVLEADVPSKRRVLPDEIVRGNSSDLISTVVKKVNLYSQRNNPILVFAQNIEESEAISKELTTLGVKHRLLNAKNAEEEAEVIKEAGKSKAITIITTMAGRGTDIVVDEASKKDGGLIIFAAGHLKTERHDLQLIGRTGRRGDPGVVQFFSLATLSPAENKMIDLVSKSSVDEAKHKIEDIVRKNIAREQQMEEKQLHDVRDFLSSYYKVIDSQFIMFQLAKNKILSMNYDELSDYIIELFGNNVMKDLIKTEMDNGATVLNRDLQSIKKQLAECLAGLCSRHYNVLTQNMKQTSVMPQNLQDPFSNFQRFAIEQYEEVILDYQKEARSIVLKGLLKK